MARQYKKLLEPILFHGILLKNRMICAQSLPHFIQGSEPYPTDTMIQYVGNLAKNGAAVIILPFCSMSDRNAAMMPDGKRFPMFDYSDPCLETSLTRMCELVHFYGSKLSIQLGLDEIPDLEGCCAQPEEVTPEQMRNFAGAFAQRAMFFQKLGFDMVSLQMGLRGHTHVGLAAFLSPLSNSRTDIYGGSVAGRARFPLEVCKAIRESCGTNFLIDATIIGEEEPGGITVADTVEFAKLAEGLIDILQIRPHNGDLAHPTGFNLDPREPLTLHVAEAVVQSGVDMLVAPVAGFQDPEQNEEFLRQGRAHMISMARAFIADPEYGSKLRQGCAEDIIPCIRCAKCHVPFIDGPWVFRCSVNPTAGLAQYLSPSRATVAAKKVAVVGGGPAGMLAAITAAKDGHRVTLYEKTPVLGGQLIHSDYAAFKWPLKAYKDYLIRQIKKMGVQLKLGTVASPALLTEEVFDHVIAAVGAIPRQPSYPIDASSCVYTPLETFGREAELGRNIAVIGGSDIGTETALYLAEAGHIVTVLTRNQHLAYNATIVHYKGSFERRWKANPNFSSVVGTTVKEVTGNVVYYLEADGSEHQLAVDAVVVSSGMDPCSSEALSFYGVGQGFSVAGDCVRTGNVQSATRSAYAAAKSIGY